MSSHTSALLILTLVTAGFSVSNYPQKQCSGDSSNLVHINILLEMSTTASCDGQDLSLLSGALAVEWLIEEANAGNLNTITVPGITYGVQFLDICNNKSLTVRQAGSSIAQGVWIDKKLCLTLDEEDWNDKSLLLGLIGPSRSSNAVEVAEFLNETNIPLISPTASLTDLGDRSKYSTFYRTIPSDDLQVQIILQLASYLDWPIITLIHSDDNYGRAGADRIEHYAKLNGICVTRRIEINLEMDKTNTVVDLRTKVNPAGIVYFGQVEEFVSLLSTYIENVQMYQSYPRRTIIVSEAVAKSDEVFKKLQQAEQRYVQEQLRLITISQSFSQQGRPAALTNYISRRFRNQTGGSGFTDGQLNYCKQLGTCTADTLHNGETENMLKSALGLFSAYKTTHSSICSREQVGSCRGMKLTDNFYSCQHKSLSDMDTMISINGTSYDLKFPNSNQTDYAPAYKLHIVTLDTLAYKEVGTGFTDGTVEFGGSAEEVTYYAGVSYCPAIQCPACKPKEPSYVFKKGNSSLLIIGSSAVRVPGTSADTCGAVRPFGFLRMQAFYFSLKHIEQHTGFTFNTIFIDFCYSSIRAYSILENMFQPQSLIAQDSAGNIVKFSYDSVVAAIGDNSSGISTILQGFLKLFNIPQISFASTSPSLSDKFLFPTFIRNVPSDSEMAVSMVQVAKTVGIRKFALIYSDTLYGLTGSEKVKQTAQQEKNMCIDFEGLISAQNRDEDIEHTVDYLVSSEHKTLAFILFCEEFIIKDIIERLERSSRQYVWSERGRFFIAGETWGSKPQLIQDRIEITRGTITLDFDHDLFNWTEKTGINHFKSYVETLSPVDHQNDHLFLMCWQDNFNCSVKGIFDTLHQSACTTECNLTSITNTCRGRWTFDFEEVYAKRMVMALYSIGYAIADAISEGVCSKNCSSLFMKSSTAFLDRLQRTKIPNRVVSPDNLNPSRELLPFSETGDGQANYDVYSIDTKAPEYELIYEVSNGQAPQREGRQPKYFPAGHETFMTEIDHEKCPELTANTSNGPTLISSGEMPEVTSTSDCKDSEQTLIICRANFVFSVIILIVLIIFIPAVLHYSCHREVCYWLLTKLGRRQKIINNGEVQDGTDLGELGDGPGNAVERREERERNEPEGGVSRNPIPVINPPEDVTIANHCSEPAMHEFKPNNPGTSEQNSGDSSSQSISQVLARVPNNNSNK